MAQATESYRNVFLPLIAVSKAVKQVHLTAPHISDCQNPVHLSRPMDRENPDILFPVFCSPCISPELMVKHLTADSGQCIGGKNSTSLEGVAVYGVSGKKLLDYSGTAVDASVIEEGSGRLKSFQVRLSKPIQPIIALGILRASERNENEGVQVL